MGRTNFRLLEGSSEIVNEKPGSERRASFRSACSMIKSEREVPRKLCIFNMDGRKGENSYGRKSGDSEWLQAMAKAMKIAKEKEEAKMRRDLTRMAAQKRRS